MLYSHRSLVLSALTAALPGPRLDGAGLYELMEAEGVTVSAGVPTIWLALIQRVPPVRVLDVPVGMPNV